MMKTVEQCERRGQSQHNGQSSREAYQGHVYSTFARLLPHWHLLTMRDTRHRHPRKRMRTKNLNNTNSTNNPCYPSGEGQEPEQSLGTAVGTMCSRAECSTKDDHQCSEDKCDLSSHAIAHQADEQLANNCTWMRKGKSQAM